MISYFRCLYWLSKLKIPNIINSSIKFNMKFSLLCILICTHMCLARNIKTNKNVLRIVGGRNATEDEFPYVVKLMVQSMATRAQGNVFVCTGAALTSKWTLTAGHCVTGLQTLMASSSMVQTKAVIEYVPSPKSDVAYSEIMSSTVPPSMNLNVDLKRMKNDIGLLHTQPVLFAKYAKLSPIDYAALNGQEVALVGFGMMKHIDEDPPFLPRVLEVVVKQCHDIIQYPEMCFAPSCAIQTSKAICLGDSGGPAIHASGIVSVNTITDIRNCGMSLGPSSRRDRYETGYYVGSATPVSPYVDWISSIMRTDSA